MRSVRLLAAAVAIGASAVTAACGQQQGGTPGTPAPDRSPGSSPPGAALGGCRGSFPVPAGRTLTLGNADNGKTFCAKPGSMVLLILRGAPGRMWKPVQDSSGALAPRANGRLALARWVTGASYLAAHPGTAVLASARPVCPVPASPGTPASSPSGVRCTADLVFRVTVVVVGA